MDTPRSRVAVLGAGVVGLTTACLLQSQGFQVTLVSQAFPGDPHDADDMYTSPKAGAHWRSMADAQDTRLQDWDAYSFKVFQRLCSIPESGVMTVKGYEVFPRKPNNWQDPWFAHMIPNYNGQLSKNELRPGMEFGISYDTVTYNVPVYLAWLLKQFKTMGGLTLRKQIHHLHDLQTIAPFIVNCSGLASRFLGGVLDKQVQAARGQTVLVRAPRCNYTITTTGGEELWKSSGKGKMVKNEIMKIDDFAYVIPRKDGIVVLGGTYDVGCYSLEPNPDTTRRIIKQCVNLCPELVTANNQPDIVAVCVGLRPLRQGGVRLEGEWINKSTYVVHNYGHGGYGYQSSWGCAESVVKLIEKASGKGPLGNSVQKLMSKL